MTALLAELGFTAIERAQLRRSCRDIAAEPLPSLESNLEDGEIREEDEEATAVDECVFLTGSDIFGDGIGVVTDASHLVAQSAAPPLQPSSVVASHWQPAVPSSMPSSAQASNWQPFPVPAPASSAIEHVFLTGDYFGDDASIVADSRSSGFPPPPLATPLVNIQSQPPAIPAPEHAPMVVHTAFSQFAPAPMQYPQRPVPVQQPILGLPKAHPSIAEFPSVGSRDHHLGTCKPCAYFGDKGCQSGMNCQYCHICPPGELKRRQKARRSAQRRSRYMNLPAQDEQPTYF